jgi:aldehyde dehydrogenase (NAD+)
MLGTRASILYEPKGVCLIIAPWNYPFNLSAGPLVSALAAGNAVIIKPSELTNNTSALINRMCREIFEPQVVSVVEGDASVSQELLKLPFDHIFFTGSPAVGKIVMRAAAEHLTSVTLELGGKSPTIITASAKVNEAAQRVAVAKFINNGQTCIAPDYVLVHTSVLKPFVEALKSQVQNMFAKETTFQQSADYARVVNAKHYQRLHSLVEDAVQKGAIPELTGPSEESDNFIHPIILTSISADARIMEEEIFGPVLPVLPFNSLDEVISMINSKPKPLALYYFGDSSSEIKRIKQETSSGAICINDCAIHFLHHSIPFGGVNNSGIGKSHGYFGFQAFSNEKPVLKQRHGLTSVRGFYPPYTNLVKRMVDGLLKFF